MGEINVNDILITPLKKVDLKDGAVMHAMKQSEDSFKGFGEAYFSQINPGAIKAWKLHLKMTMNIVVPIGEVNFVFIDSSEETRSETLGENKYLRLTVPPGIWFGFKGMSKSPSLLLNVANIEHSPEEVQRKNIDEFNYNWETGR
jgi:dTDP-4-dehydrorhamnose 3,5-epimerase